MWGSSHEWGHHFILYLGFCAELYRAHFLAIWNCPCLVPLGCYEQIQTPRAYVPSSWLLFRKLVLDGQDYHVETWLMWWVSEKDLFCYHTGLPFSLLMVTILAGNFLGSADNSTLSIYSGIKIYTRPFTVFFM